MKHNIIRKIGDTHPYEIVEIEIIPENSEERNWIDAVSAEIENYLSIVVETVDVIELNPPFFIVKKVKRNIGI